jgi:hypothetical protein
MKKHLRKTVSLILVLAMTLAVSVPAFAETKDSGKELKDNGQNIVDNFTKAENTKVIEQAGIATYFFESTNDYTVCIGKYPSGLLDIAYIDKSNPDILYSANIKTGLTTDGSNTFTQSSDSAIDFEKIKSDIIAKIIPMKEESIKKSVSNNLNAKTNNMANNKSDAQMIGESLAKSYGTQYTNKFLTSLSKNGLTAKLYQAKYFNIYDSSIEDFLFDVTWTLAKAAAKLDFNVGTVKALLGSAVALINGEYKIKREVGVHKYNSEVIYYKDVRIGNQSPYRAAREIDFSPYVCPSEGTMIQNKTRDFADSDFNDNVGLLEKGIELY